MKIVLWIGKDSNQIALAEKINSLFPVSAVFIENRKSKRNYTLSLLFGKIIERIFLSVISNSWFGMLTFYEKYKISISNEFIFNVSNINSDEVYNKTQLIKPDLIIVSGTRLIKDKLLSIKPKIGILNLHTGLSPYIKGGPNCTNWCIANKQFHLIGNTVMWIDKGIDSGKIVASEFTKFNGDENLLQIHIKVMEHAHSLYLRSIEMVLNKDIEGVMQSEIDFGFVYYNKDWNLYQKIKLFINLKSFKSIVNSDSYIQQQKLLKTIKV